MSLDKAKALDIAKVLTEALPYIQRFTRKTIVTKLGGSALIKERGFSVKTIIDYD